MCINPPVRRETTRRISAKGGCGKVLMLAPQVDLPQCEGKLPREKSMVGKRVEMAEKLIESAAKYVR